MQIAPAALAVPLCSRSHLRSTRRRRPASAALLGLLLWATGAPPGHAEIREIMKMSDVMKEVDEDTLFITDLDNTVVETPQMLGSDQAYSHLVKRYVAAGDTREAAIQKSGGLWVSVQRVTRVQAVEAETPALFRALQERGVRVMALTARPTHIVGITERQMKDLGVDFTRTAPRCKLPRFRAPSEARYVRGIIYSDRNNKGHALTQFLRRCRLRPRKIVFVDDKERNVKNVHRELAARWPKVPHIEFRYGAADPKVKALDAKVLDVQIEHFNKLLSDDDARGLLEKR